MYIPTLAKLSGIDDEMVSTFFSESADIESLGRWADASVAELRLGAGLEKLFQIKGDNNPAAGELTYSEASHQQFLAFRVRVVELLGPDDEDRGGTQEFEYAIAKAFRERVRGCVRFDPRNLGSAGQCRFIAGYYLPDVVARKARYGTSNETRAANLLGLKRVQKGLIFRAFRSATLLCEAEQDLDDAILRDALEPAEQGRVLTLREANPDCGPLWPLAALNADAFVQLFERVGSATLPGVFAQLAVVIACHSTGPATNQEDFVRSFMKSFNLQAGVVDFTSMSPGERICLMTRLARAERDRTADAHT